MKLFPNSGPKRYTLIVIFLLLGFLLYRPRTIVVRTVADSNPFRTSLRMAIKLVADGGTITFAPSLKGKTITLSGKDLYVNKSLTITAASIGGITINTKGESRHFFVSGEETHLQLENITLIGEKRTFIEYHPKHKVYAETRHPGGSILADKASLTLTNCTVSGNTAEIGGGIYADGGTHALTNCTISGNSGDDQGGGISGNNSSFTLTNCTIFGNSAARGGGILFYGGTHSLINCTVSGNSAREVGGNFFYSGSHTLINCTISGNTAEKTGGIYAYESNLTIRNSIVSENCSEGIEEDLLTISSPFIGTNNIIGFDPGFTVAPVFDSSGKLANRKVLDLSPSSTSWGIDRGNNAYVTTETDGSGAPRIIRTWESVPTVDIGAIEYSSQIDIQPEAPSAVVTTASDVINEGDYEISLREAFLYANPGDTITFANSMRGKTIRLAGIEIRNDSNISVDASSIGGITIDAGKKSRIVSVTGDKTQPIYFTGITFTGGKAKNAGGINAVFTNLTLNNCKVTGNSAEEIAGGIYAADSILTLNSCKISKNSVKFKRTLVYDGKVGYGGGILTKDSTLTLNNCSVTENSSIDFGGGIYASCKDSNQSTSTLTNCTIQGNSADRTGGGICLNHDFFLSLIDCTISENTACGGEGGGIGVQQGYDSKIILQNTTIQSNTAADNADISSGSANVIHL